MSSRSHAHRPRRARTLPRLLVPGIAALGLASASMRPPPPPPQVAFDLSDVDNGFSRLLPHAVHRLDGNGQPTPDLVAIRRLDALIANVRPNNRVLPARPWPAAAQLPNGAAGNHFLAARFTAAIEETSVLDPTGTSPSGLTGTITVVAFDPTNGATTVIPGRAFIGGRTFAGTPSGSPPMLPLQTWVRNVGGALVADATIDNDHDGVPDGLGFPGTIPGTSFPGDVGLVDDGAFVFVPDADGKLSTYETFATAREIRIRISTSVRSAAGTYLLQPASVCDTVGPDVLRPEVALTPPPISAPIIVPGNGDSNVDPTTSVQVQFTEPVQPLSVGSLPDGHTPVLSSSIVLQFGPANRRVIVPLWAEPVSPYDLTQYRLLPSFAFPGEGPPSAQCGVFDRVDIDVNAGQLADLSANTNLLGAVTYFTTGPGPGLVNAPVTPDAIYAGIAGALPGVSVVDLNGFGASTGDPTFDPTYQTFPEGNSNFPNDPNVKLQGSFLIPPLHPGTCTVDGGASGVFRRTLDSNLSPLVLGAPIVTSISDMMLGHALDATFDNGPAPFGCQSGGGNLCASNGKKRIGVMPTGTQNTLVPGPGSAVGAENLCSWSPHPNPPPLVFPPLCVSPSILAEEPTSIDTPVSNILVPGDPFGSPLQGIPPSGLLTAEQNAFFQGPSLEHPVISQCSEYMIRQQIGQFLYVIDRARRELVVLNSNRMTVIDRIELDDPTEMAMSPNLSYLAITNQFADKVTFIDIDPFSATFHRIVSEVQVGHQPRGIAWEPGNEDILVCNEGEGSLSIIAASSLTVRKVVHAYMEHPFAVAITPRQFGFGFQRDVYFGFVLDRNGRVAVFESGPNGVNGWGYDDTIGVVRATFHNPQTIQPDPLDLRGAVWIAHQGPIHGPPNEPALSKLVLSSGQFGLIPLQPGSPPHFRDLQANVQVSLGGQTLSGMPVDIAFDDMRNLGGLPNRFTPFSAGAPVLVNGKTSVRDIAGTIVNTNEPRYIFAAVPNPASGTGVIDVILLEGAFNRVDTNHWQSGIQSIPAPGVRVVMDYFRQ